MNSRITNCTLAIILGAGVSGCVRDGDPLLDRIESNHSSVKISSEAQIGTPTRIYGRRIVFESGEVLLNKDAEFLGTDEFTLKRLDEVALGVSLRDQLCAADICAPIARMSPAFMARLEGQK